MPPTCSTCKHFWSERNNCHHPDLLGFDVIHGEEPVWARHARERGSSCGPEGKLWEAPPEEKTDWFIVAVTTFVIVGSLLAILFVRV